MHPPSILLLRNDLCDPASANGQTAFADSEFGTIFNRDLLDQFDFQTIHVVTGENHLNAIRQGYITGNIGGVDVELRAITGEESAVASALFLLEDVNRALKLGMWGDGIGFRQNHTALDLFAIDTA